MFDLSCSLSSAASLSCRLSSLFLPVLLLFVAVGCAGGNGVSGTITLDGEPLPDARVQFTPTDKQGRIASGQTDSNGFYSLKTSRTVT
jgi:hypothetical protein